MITKWCKGLLVPIEAPFANPFAWTALPFHLSDPRGSRLGGGTPLRSVGLSPTSESPPRWYARTLSCYHEQLSHSRDLAPFEAPLAYPLAWTALPFHHSDPRGSWLGGATPLGGARTERVCLATPPFILCLEGGREFSDYKAQGTRGIQDLAITRH